MSALGTAGYSNLVGGDSLSYRVGVDEMHRSDAGEGLVLAGSCVPRGACNRNADDREALLQLFRGTRCNTDVAALILDKDIDLILV